MSVIANRGPQENPDYSPLGESINAAFRLESSIKNSGFDVALGRLAFECLSVAPNLASHFEKRIIELKGFELPVEVYLTSYPRVADFLKAPERPITARA